MKSLNKVSIIGHLGSDPEHRTTQSGASVVNFSVAANYSVKVEEEWRERVEWIRIQAWNKLADICAEYLHKGSYVFCEGRLSTQSWQGEDGIKRWSTSVIVRDIIFLDSKSQSQKSDRPPAPPQEDTEDGMTAKPEDGSQAGGYDASEEDPTVPF